MPDSEKAAVPVTAKRIAALLDAIEREPIPERLMALARELQDALRNRAAEADEKP